MDCQNSSRSNNSFLILAESFFLLLLTFFFDRQRDSYSLWLIEEKYQQPQNTNNGRKLFFFFLIFLEAATICSNAQESKFFIEPSIHVGRIIKHTTPFPQIKHNSVSIDINFTRKTNGNKLWHRLYHQPVIGIILRYSNFGDKNILGSAIALIPNLTFSRSEKKIKFYSTFGTGLAYLNRPYDLIENEMNNVIGSKINNTTYINLGFEFNVSPDFFLNPSISLIHYSNGRAKVPNLGYNISSVSLIGKYLLNESIKPIRIDSTPPVNKKIHPGIEVNFGFNQMKVSRGPVYSIYGGKIYATKNLTLKNKLTSGVEYFFDKGIYDFIVLNETYTENQKMYASRFIYFLAHEFIMGHIGLLGQGGFYLNKPFNPGTKFPTKLGIQYYTYTPYFKNRSNIYFGIYLAAHSFEADYVAMSVGYNF